MKRINKSNQKKSKSTIIGSIGAYNKDKPKFSYRKFLYPLGVICFIYLVIFFSGNLEKKYTITCENGSEEHYNNITDLNNAIFICGEATSNFYDEALENANNEYNTLKNESN